MRKLAFLTVLTAVALGAGAANADVTALTPDAARSFAAERAPDSLKAATPAMAAERLRAGLVLNPEAFMAAQAPLEQQALRLAFGTMGPREATHIAWYFRGAVTVAAAGGGSSVLFYNPLTDVGALTGWRRVDGTWRLVAVRLVDGASLRATNRDYWLEQAAAPYRQALADRAGPSLSPFVRLPPAGSAPVAFGILRTRVNALEGGLAALRADAGRQAAAEALVTAIRTGDVRKLGREHPSKTDLQALPAEVRDSLTVVAAFRRADGQTLAIASPLRPSLLIFADFDEGGAVVRVGAVNIAAAQAKEVRS